MQNEKVKLQASRSRSRSKLSNLTPNDDTSQKSKDMPSHTKKTSTHDFGVEGVRRSTQGNIDYNAQIMENKRQRFMKETISKLSKDMENEERELKALTAELQK